MEQMQTGPAPEIAVPESPRVQVPPEALGQKALSSGTYATFFQRFAAALIDGILIGITYGIISSVFGIGGNAGSTVKTAYSRNFGLIPTLIFWAYAVFMDVKYGATLGKMALKIRVQNMDTGQNLTWLEAILRESVGKMLSSFVLFLGYLWMLWDDKKQCWHDKVGKSTVVRV